MTLRFTWNWEHAPDVRLPELAATWARLGIEVGGTFATLVEERDGSFGPRKYLDVPTYPLAELLAVNWWQLNATSHLPSDPGVRLVDAAEGFPWPDLTLRSDRGLMWTRLRQRDKAPEYVRFLTQGEMVMQADIAISEIARFIDLTVRRLEDQGITRTLLQEEWNGIQDSHAEEREYCLLAAAWGQDPYDTPSQVEATLLDAGSVVSEIALLSDLARVVPLSQLDLATDWLRTAARALRTQHFELPEVGRVDWSSAAGLPAWRVGYGMARQLRQLLGLSELTSAPISELIALRASKAEPPNNVDAVMRIDNSKGGVVVGAGTPPIARRFVGARALGRRTLNPAGGGTSLLTRGSRYGERAERAFAAEFLAPAAGIAELLGGDLSDDSLQRAAKHFRVSSLLIEHQVENQLAA